MDAIDNLIYTTLNPCCYPPAKIVEAIDSQFQDLNLDDTEGSNSGSPTTFPTNFSTATGVTSYQDKTREEFAALDDTQVVEDAIKKHWYDIANQVSYTERFGEVDLTGNNFLLFNPSNPPYDPTNSSSKPQAFVKFNTPPYHLIFSYLVENTRVAQIFEKLIWMYLHDEKLTKIDDPLAFKWIMNTEALFYEDTEITNRRDIISQLRPVSEATRRNAYQRMFGMDLAFGDINNNQYPYEKADFNNSAFISLFESLLVEFWQAYINANNTSGQNTTDLEQLENISRRLQEMLMSRRTTALNFNNYRYYNLSKEEYSSYVFMYWLFHIISYDSPVVKFLNCNANTPGERLINIGKKVNIPAHTKSVPILDISQPMNSTLRSIELGLFNNAVFLGRVIKSHATTPSPTPQEIEILNNLLLITNNWEKATGHRIKNPETKLNGTLKIEQKTGKPVLAAN